MKKANLLLAAQTVTACTAGVVVGTIAASYIVTSATASLATKIIGGAAVYVCTSMFTERVVNKITNPIIVASLTEEQLQDI